VANNARASPAQIAPNYCLWGRALVYTAYTALKSLERPAKTDTMQTFDYDNLKIRYLRTGSGPPIVMLHNGGTSHAIWTDLIALLDGYEIFALDLLGFGESSKPESGYELERYVAILGAFIDAHGLAPTYLVGNCMGSATSLAFAMERPEAVRSMVLINTLTTHTFSGGLYAPMSVLPKRAPALVSALSKIPLGARLGQFGVRSQIGRYGREREIDKRPELAACYASSTQSRSLLRVLADIPNYARLDRFEAPADFPPICSIWGAQNKVLRAAKGRALVGTLRPARQEWLAGCGHLPMLERPEQVAGIIHEFFSHVSADA